MTRRDPPRRRRSQEWALASLIAVGLSCSVAGCRDFDQFEFRGEGGAGAGAAGVGGGAGASGGAAGSSSGGQAAQGGSAGTATGGGAGQSGAPGGTVQWVEYFSAGKGEPAGLQRTASLADAVIIGGMLGQGLMSKSAGPLVLGAQQPYPFAMALAATNGMPSKPFPIASSMFPIEPEVMVGVGSELLLVMQTQAEATLPGGPFSFPCTMAQRATAILTVDPTSVKRGFLKVVCGDFSGATATVSGAKFFVAGRHTEAVDFGTGSLTPTLPVQVAVASYDHDGKNPLARTFETEAQVLTIADDGGPLVTEALSKETTVGGVTLSPNKAFPSSLYVARFRTTSLADWAVPLYSDGFGGITASRVLPTGETLMMVTHGGNTNIDGQPLKKFSGQSTSFVRLNSFGVLQWEYACEVDNLHAVDISTTGEIVAAGFRNNGIACSDSTYSDSGFFAFKLNAFGQVMWHRTWPLIGANANGEFRSIALDANASAYITGLIHDGEVSFDGPAKSSDFPSFVLKLSP